MPGTINDAEQRMVEMSMIAFLILILRFIMDYLHFVFVLNQAL